MADSREKRAEAPAARRVTAVDVARLAGVSRSAVSRTYTPGASVAGETRERIMAVAERLGYRPNSLAASLKLSSSNLVAIATGNLTNFYDSTVTGQLVKRLNAIGKWAVVIGGTTDEVGTNEILDVLAYPLDAMIVRAGSIDKETALKCLKLNVPLILSGRVMELERVDSVCCDNRAGAGIAVGDFLAAGRQRIGYIGGPKELYSEQQRYEGFLERLSAEGLAPAALEWADFSFEGGYEAALRILRRDNRPDALFCCNDAMALGAINAARDTLGFRVPEDVAIIGFDDIDMAAWPCFDLTTIRNPIDDTVDEIMRLLERRLANPASPAEIVNIAPEIVRRGTN